MPMSYSRSFADPEAARRAGAGPLEQACAVVGAREWGMGRRDGTLAAGPLAVRAGGMAFSGTLAGGRTLVCMCVDGARIWLLICDGGRTVPSS